MSGVYLAGLALATSPPKRSVFLMPGFVSVIHSPAPCSKGAGRASQFSMM